MSSLAYKHRQSAVQDALLQSYRGFMFTTQSILVAVGAGLCTAIIFCDSISKMTLLFVLFLTVFGLALYCGLMFRRVIRSRQKDVDYWQNKIIEAERLLLYDERILTAFKIHQKTNRQELDHAALYLKMDDPTVIASLIEKGKGHTRAIIDGILPFAYFATWVVFLLIILLNMLAG